MRLATMRRWVVGVVLAFWLVTAGAALVHLDLSLWMVRRHSSALAALTARYLVVDPRVSQVAGRLGRASWTRAM